MLIKLNVWQNMKEHVFKEDLYNEFLTVFLYNVIAANTPHPPKKTQKEIPTKPGNKSQTKR